MRRYTINKYNFAPNIILITLDILIVSIYQLYAMIRYTFLNINFSGMKITINSYYLIMNILVMYLIAHIGHCITSQAESILTIIAKNVSKLPSQRTMTTEFYNLLRQFQSRNIKLQTVFFGINWNIDIALNLLLSYFNV